MVLEIDYFLECIRTTNTADFKNSINPYIPLIQIAENITAPPFSYCDYMRAFFKSAWPYIINLFYCSHFASNAVIVVKVSPNCVKNADKIAISSSDLSFAIVHANVEMNVTNSHEFNIYHLYFNI